MVSILRILGKGTGQVVLYKACIGALSVAFSLTCQPGLGLIKKHKEYLQKAYCWQLHKIEALKTFT
jgi:hypothetical protein